MNPQTNSFYVSSPLSPLLISASLSSVQSALVCSLPGHQKEDTADSQVGKKHKEPDSRGEGIQEGEVAWPSSLKETHKHSQIIKARSHQVTIWSYVKSHDPIKGFGLRG